MEFLIYVTRKYLFHTRSMVQDRIALGCKIGCENGDESNQMRNLYLLNLNTKMKMRSLNEAK